MRIIYIKAAIVLSAIIFFNSCGSLLQEPGLEPTYQQKTRGIWIVGGLTGEYITSTAAEIDLYDPEKNAFYKKVATLPTPVSFAGVVSYGGKIFVIGGFNNAGAAVAVTQIYDVTTDEWTSGSSLGQPRANIDAVVVYDKIYIVGGTINNADNTTFSILNQVTMYDITADSWSALVTAPGSIANHTSFALNDIIYFLGGRTTATSVSTAHNGYMVSSPTPALSSAAELVLTTMTARIGMAGVMYAPVNGPPLEILIGGYSTLTGVTGNYIFNSDTTYNPIPVAQVRYLYNQFTVTPWLSASDYPHTVGLASAVVYTDKIYCFGGAVPAGAGSLTVYNDVYALDLSDILTGIWNQQATMPTARFGHVALKIRQ